MQTSPSTQDTISHLTTSNATTTTTAAALPGNLITSFEGIDGNEGGTVNPPDVTLAAGPGKVIEMVNRLIKIFEKTGAIAKLPDGRDAILDLASFFSFRDDNNNLVFDPNTFDPSVVYDAQSQRFFATASTQFHRTILAVSQTDDPTGNWNTFSFPFDGGCPDYPTLGYSSDKVAITVNNFVNGDCSSDGDALGDQFYIINKADLLQGNINNSCNCWEQSTSNLNFRILREVPSLSPTTTLRMVEVDTNDNHLYLHSFSNPVPNSIASDTPQSFAIGIPEVITIKGGATQPNSADPTTLDPSIDTGDNRVISANWFQGRLLTAFNEDFQDPDNVGNNNLVRTGFRINEVDTTNSALLADLAVRRGAFDFYYPAITVDVNGNIGVVFGFSAEDVYPSLVAWTLAANSPGTITSQTVLVNGQTSSVAFVGTKNRYGDYFGAAVDPFNPSDMWVAGGIIFSPEAQNIPLLLQL